MAVTPGSRFEARGAALTHVGVVRSLNEDACLERVVSPLAGIWTVADGMGGHEAGDLASRMIIEAFEDVTPPANLSELVDEVEARLLGVHQYLCEMARARSRAAVVGATVAALLSFRRQGVCLWAGDSRVYLWREGALRCLTRDHSEVEELLAEGAISPEEAVDHPLANVITRAVGGTDELELETRFQALEPGDRYLVCTDGLYKMMSEREIAAVIASGTPSVACTALVDTCNARGAIDNVSVVVVDFAGES